MQRKHALLNPKSVMRQPMTLEDHQNSRWVVYPFRLLDCCLETDGATAIVVSTAEQARDLNRSGGLARSRASQARGVLGGRRTTVDFSPA